jgi:hypothetical protein
MRLIRRSRDIAAFDALASKRVEGAVFPLPLSALGRAYYEATLGESREEVSFLVEHEGEALVVFIADVEAGKLGRYGMPAELLIDRSAERVNVERAINEAMGEIGRLVKTSAPEVEILTWTPGGEADYCTGQLVAASYDPAPHLRAVVSLLGDASLETALRKGHRQAARWGKENLGIEIVDAERRDRAAFDSFRRLHFEVAGRATRGDASWNVMYEAIASGSGRLVLSRLGEELVGGTLVLDNGGVAVYASGAYRRDHFDKPLAHYPLLVAMELSRTAGRVSFDIGDVSPSPQLTPKERAIAYFKRGFTNRLKVALLFRLSPPREARAETVAAAP